MSDETAPVLRVVRGNPTAEELAALVVTLVTRTPADGGEPRTHRSAWASYWNTHRGPLAPGAGAWRASSLPR